MLPPLVAMSSITVVIGAFAVRLVLGTSDPMPTTKSFGHFGLFGPAERVVPDEACATACVSPCPNKPDTFHTIIVRRSEGLGVGTGVPGIMSLTYWVQVKVVPVDRSTGVLKVRRSPVNSRPVLSSITFS